MALMSFGFGLIFRSTAAAIATFAGVMFVLPLVMHTISEHDRPLPADQHPHQLDHADCHRAGRALTSALAGRRVVADGPLHRDRPRRRSRTLREARRLSEPGTKVGWVQIRIPGSEPSRPDNWPGSILQRAVPEAQLGGARVLPGQLRVGAAAAFGLVRWIRRTRPQRRLRRCPHPRRRPAGRPGARPMAADAGPGVCWARRSPSPSRSPPARGSSGGCGRLRRRAAWRSVGYFVARVPLTIFGVWFALSVWLEALFGVASPSPAITARPVRPARPSCRRRVPSGAAGLRDPRRRVRAGVVFLFVAPWTMRFVVYVDRG